MQDRVLQEGALEKNECARLPPCTVSKGLRRSSGQEAARQQTRTKTAKAKSFPFNPNAIAVATLDINHLIDGPRRAEEVAEPATPFGKFLARAVATTLIRVQKL